MQSSHARAESAHGLHTHSDFASPQEFDAFYGAHRDTVYRVLVRAIGDHHLAVEAVNEAMTRAWHHWTRVRDYRNQSGWVYRVAFNWAMSQIRRRSREVLAADPEVGVYEDQLPHTDLYDLLLTLDRDQRAVVVLRYFLGWSEVEIAEALGVPKGTVKRRASRALKKLRLKMEEPHGH